MHALQIPFTGFFVGGFAVICIGLIAYYSKFNFKQILQATFLVVLVKATVSPQSPVAAYFAVAFQGVFGAIIYCGIKNFKLASLLFGFIALVESALQKFIFLTIVFGKSIWQALDIFITDTLQLFSLHADFSFSYWLIFIYTLVYALWGLLIGYWISELPLQIENNQHLIIGKLKPYVINAAALPENKKDKNMHRKFWLVILLFIVAVLLLNFHSHYQIVFVMLRTFAAMFIVFYVLTPLVKWMLQK